uniref:UBC core domain-containing protein n=1 Tax=Aureoumbra lagunensis TaxID=44058 RepID=A0A7S3NKX8_9STRA|mmetsp:Transcript_21917/g.33781  ORF Transcript_21917/g.33781 Transcript_21917/m.33781 type:complete len:981 (-) Transcript_21917:232-3174(-)
MKQVLEQSKDDRKESNKNVEAKLRVPTEDEVVRACLEAKNEYPEFGVKRVYLYIIERRPEWQLTMRRVQRIMRSRHLTATRQNNVSQAERIAEIERPLCFPDDCVSLSRRRSQVGWVLRAAGVLGGEEDDESESDEEEKDELDPGTARVQWLERYEPTIEKTKDLIVLDRPLVAGDIVARRHDPTGPLGTVTQVQMCADVRLIHISNSDQGKSRTRSARSDLHNLKIKSIIKGIDIALIHPVGKVRNGDAVGHKRDKRWIGRVIDATYDLTVKACGFAQGQSCVLRAMHEHNKDFGRALEPREDTDYSFDELCPYFPGQRLSAPAAVWRGAHWGNKKPNGRTFTLGLRSGGRKHCIVEKVQLNHLYIDWLAFGPKASQTPPPTWVNANDIIFMPAFASTHRVGDHVTICATELLKALGETTSHMNSECCVQVVQTQTTCHVKWGEATEDHTQVMVPSLELVPRQQLGDHDFLPHDFVIPVKDDESVDKNQDEERIGVVETVDSKQRTVVVQWKDNQAREKYSVYELALHPSLNLHAGELVLRLAPGVGLTTGRVATQTEDGSIHVVQVSENVSFAEARDIATAIRLSLANNDQDNSHIDDSDGQLDGKWVGQVTTLESGFVHVTWLDGSKSIEAPTQLLPVPEARSDMDEDEDYQVDDSLADEGDYDSLEDNTASTLDDYEEALNEPETILDTSIQALPHSSMEALEESALEQEDYDDGGVEAFAVVESLPPSDHHFESTTPQQLPLPVVRKLWTQLSRNLPSGIAVRAFQSRSDLLRALIIGPEDTPYNQLLFVFDLQLPKNYPAEPPDVHYRACGVQERLNPNLYACGKVCLSLLGTWSGPGWDPAKSTVLQLLVSIQGLVLSPQPYYNEPGNEKHQGTIEGEHQSHHYNEAATLLSIKTTISLLKHPPQPLTSVIADHLRTQKFNDFINSVDNQLVSASSSSVSASEGFLRVLRKVLPQLRTTVERFIRNYPEKDTG